MNRNNSARKGILNEPLLTDNHYFDPTFLHKYHIYRKNFNFVRAMVDQRPQSESDTDPEEDTSRETKPKKWQASQKLLRNRDYLKHSGLQWRLRFKKTLPRVLGRTYFQNYLRPQKY